MAKLIPELSDHQLAELRSQAEAKVYRALRDGLGKDYLVLFQVTWILCREDEQAKDGEIDFIICHPDAGYLCIEVKGGGIGFDANTGEWFSVDRGMRKHAIKNPIGQALRAKYSIRSKLNESRRWHDLGLANVLRGHAVFFPDLNSSDAVARPDMPRVAVGCATDLSRIQEWVESAFAYWGKDVPDATLLTRRGLDVFQDIFARSFVAAPLISARLAEQEIRRLALTNDQIRVLDFLRGHRRVAVSGGAGTGKTILAVEKARRLASEGFKTLLTCYNRPLADHLASVCGGTDNLDVKSFHQLCYQWTERANQQSGRDLLAEARVTYPGTDLYDVQLPNAFAYSLEVLPDRYDAIVCDEGQDFREEYWVPIELLLADFDRSPLYVFFDDNQNIYSRTSTFPIRDEPFCLTTNCRNTAPIHSAAYKHYRGVPVSPPGIEGEDVKFDACSNRDQASKVGSIVVDLIARHGVAAADIVVLIGDAIRKSEYYGALKRQPLPKPTVWLEEGRPTQGVVHIDTIQRFKGLESPVVILWGLDAVDLTRNEEVLYVGMSRAKSILIVVGSAITCTIIKESL